MKIGIMGGTFDPIHQGHLIAAEYARTSLGLDEVIFVPAGVHPFKDNNKVTEPNKRLHMISLAIEANSHFKVSPIEINRVDTTYTIDTIKEFQEKYPQDEMYFIIGSDILFEIEEWKNFKELIKICKFILLYRPDKEQNLIEEKIQELISSHGVEFEKVASPLIEISSTEIRKRRKDQLSIKYLIPEAVENYIINNDLYIGEKRNG